MNSFIKLLYTCYRNISVFIDMDFFLFLYIRYSLIVVAFLCVYFNFFFHYCGRNPNKRQDLIGFDKMFYSIF